MVGGESRLAPTARPHPGPDTGIRRCDEAGRPFDRLRANGRPGLLAEGRAQVAGGVDEADVAEGLGEVTKGDAMVRVVHLGE